MSPDRRPAMSRFVFAPLLAVGALMLAPARGRAGFLTEYPEPLIYADAFVNTAIGSRGQANQDIRSNADIRVDAVYATANIAGLDPLSTSGNFNQADAWAKANYAAG